MAEFRYLVRVANTDLDGNKRIGFALTKIKGVNVMLANAICKRAKVGVTLRTGELSDEQITALNDVLKNPESIPVWMRNRQKDYETGADLHVISSDLTFVQDNDIKRLKMIKSYRGLRHQWNLPTRGQRTQGNFRRTKTANSKKAKRR
ncbi:MAG: 30S ribosomal protein S13 [Candidatus Woesearchaeota archaeon]